MGYNTNVWLTKEGRLLFRTPGSNEAFEKNLFTEAREALCDPSLIEVAQNVKTARLNCT